MNINDIPPRQICYAIVMGTIGCVPSLTLHNSSSLSRKFTLYNCYTKFHLTITWYFTFTGDSNTYFLSNVVIMEIMQMYCHVEGCSCLITRQDYIVHLFLPIWVMLHLCVTYTYLTLVHISWTLIEIREWG